MAVVSHPHRPGCRDVEEQMQFNLADLFEAVADAVPDRIAVVYGDRRLTYGELEARANRCAHALASLGIGRDDHVGLYLRSCPEFLEAMLGCYKLRAVPINLNDRYVAAEVVPVAGDADLRGVVMGGGLPADPSELRTPDRWVVVVGADYEQRMEASSPARDFEARSGDDRYILYTGGTTGRPKGVVWRQEDIFFTAIGGGNPGGPPLEEPEQLVPAVLAAPNQRIGAFIDADDPGPGEFVALSLGPLAHASGQWLALGTLLGAGTFVIYDALSMDMTHVLGLVERERIGMLTLVGDATARPLLDELLENPERWDTSSVRLLGSGGSILSGEVKDGLLAAMPSVAAVLEAIGSSESPSQAVALTTRDAPPSRSLTFAPKAETIVVNDVLTPIAPGSGAVGRLATRGRAPLGYYKDPDASARTFVVIDGERWTLPGDMASVDADGTIHLHGRGSLCINTGGEKVYPEEVEAVLKQHAAVFDALVVGVPDPRWGERVAAVVQPVAGVETPTLEALDAHCRATVAGYKVPRLLRVVDEVRRNPAGKADYPWARSLF
ncbi:MAG TPA: AMP-binding protein [Acidimicrobiia bacterium]|jgi:acyl-CoA synthetase (AMP-forming)/AMP-acid ligase II